MALIITFFNQKGGSAKTTSSMSIGGELALRKHKVAIVDLDEQGTATTWCGKGIGNMAYPATVFSLAAIGDNIKQEIMKHSQNYDFIIVDCPPAITSPIPWAVLQFSDLAIITTMPTQDNIWANVKAKSLAKSAKEINQKLKVRILATRVPRGNAYQITLDELKSDPDFPMYENMLSDKIAYAEAQIFGTCVGIYAPKSKASQEVRAVTQEIIDDLTGVKSW